jgi:hypothetical protein
MSQTVAIAEIGSLTYMSIRTQWQKVLADPEPGGNLGKLYSLPPLVGDPWKRTVLLTEELRELIYTEWEDAEQSKRCARLLQTLQSFVSGRHLVVCLEPYEARKADMGRLDRIEEDRVWDIRCQTRPGLRVFCHFLEKDVILAVTCRPRSVPISWLLFPPLEDNSKHWKRGIDATKREWAKWFPEFTPLLGDTVDEYLTDASLE